VSGQPNHTNTDASVSLNATGVRTSARSATASIVSRRPRAGGLRTGRITARFRVAEISVQRLGVHGIPHGIVDAS